MNNDCPCVLIKPCRSSCTCANSLMSGGCDFCPRYGSHEQQVAHAEKLITDAAELESLRDFVRSLKEFSTETGGGWYQEGKVFHIYDRHEKVGKGSDAYEAWKEFVKIST